MASTVARPADEAPAIGAVDRAVDVLMLFGRSLQPSLGVTEIAQQLGMPKSGVHRVLTTLRRRGLVTYDSATRKYALGQAAVALSQGYAARHDMTAVATQTLTSLMRATGETSTLAIRRHSTAVHRAQAVAEHELKLEVQLARPFPLHVGAVGKAFLAFLPTDESADYLERAVLPTGELPAVTDRTVADVATLRRDLARARSLGYAESTGERLVGATALAAPVRDYDEYPVSVLAVLGPAERMAARRDDIVAALLSAASGLSRQMGHEG